MTEQQSQNLFRKVDPLSTIRNNKFITQREKLETVIAKVRVFVPDICIITNHMIDWIYNRWNHLLTTYNHNPLSPANLTLHADAVHQSGAALGHCWCFIDGTVRPVCRPGVNQRVLYNGHKRVHSKKISICRIA